MSFLNRIFPSGIVTRDLGEIIFKGNRVVIQELKRAKFIPQEPEKEGLKEIKLCEKCGRSLREVVFTTLGSDKQLEVWQKYPLAVDGWICQSCGWAAFARLISVEESVEYGRKGAEHASSGQFDDAGLHGNLALVLLLTGNVGDARSEAATALTKDPHDTIIQGLIKLIDDVVAGHRQRPQSLAEAEGRKG